MSVTMTGRTAIYRKRVLFAFVFIESISHRCPKRNKKSKRNKLVPLHSVWMQSYIPEGGIYTEEKPKCTISW